MVEKTAAFKQRRAADTARWRERLHRGAAVYPVEVGEPLSPARRSVVMLAPYYTKPLSGCLSRDSRIDRGMIQDGKLRGFAMSQAIPVRTNYTAGEVRRFAQRAKDAAQARRLLAIAAVLDGASREEAATIGGMDRQTLRD